MSSVVYLAPARTLERYLAALVHPDVGDDAQARRRHVRFLGTRLLAGFAALTAFPVYLAVAGVPGLFEALAFLCLATPLAAAFFLMRTGRLAVAYDLSSLAFAALVVVMALPTGGISSPVLFWLACIPMEALASDSRRAVCVAALCAMAAAVAVGWLDHLGFASARFAAAPHAAMLFFAAGAIVHGALATLGACREQAVRNRELIARDTRERTVLDTIDDLLTWHDKAGAVLFASAAAETILGVPPRALQGHGLFERVLVSDRPAYLKAITDVANGASSVSVQFRLNKMVGPEAAGRVVWAEMRARRVPDKDDQSFAVVAVTRDITRLKTHEAELDAARAQAEEANVSKGRFLATVSHELRTPLNAIIGFSEILANGDLAGIDEERRTEYARIVHTSGHHLNEVVSALLDMSKIETGNFDFSPESTQPAEIVQGCCDLMRLKAKEKKIALELEIAPEVGEIVADRRALKQIVLNLLSNAVKFTPDGGTVSLTLQQDGARCRLAVSDSGIGIAAADLSKLGNPFFQARSSYDRPYEGTGLGLSVVKGLVGLHRGSMRIESAPGHGTTVTVSLPHDCRLAAAARPGQTIETVARVVPPPTRPDYEMVKKSA